MMGSTQSSSGDSAVRMTKDRRVDNPDIRQKICPTTWNALTLNDTGYMTSLVCELGKYKVSLAGNTESRLMGCDVTRVEDAMVIHSGGSSRLTESHLC